MGKTLKILVIQETNWVKRGPHQSHHLLERLSARGHKIRVIDFELDWYKQRGNKHLLSKRKVIHAVPKVVAKGRIIVIRPSFIRIRGLDLISIGFTQFLEIIRQIKSFKPDIVVSFGIVCGFSASYICRFYSIPFCEYWIDVLHELIPISIFKPLGLSIEKKTIRKSDLFIAINDRLLDYGKRYNPSRYALIRAGVDLDKFKENSFIRKRKRKQLEIENLEIVLFYMGFLYNFSGLDEVIKSINKEQNKRSKIKLVIVGEGDQKKQLEDIIGKYKLKNKVLMLGWQPYEEIPALISSADICLLPAHNNRVMRDIVPIKMYEYLALGKPVIATPLPGVIKEFGTNSGVIYAKNPEMVIKKCISFIDSNQKEIVGIKGRKFIESHCNWNRQTGIFLKELKSVVKLKN